MSNERQFLKKKKNPKFQFTFQQKNMGVMV